jgi:uncharacterized protein
MSRPVKAHEPSMEEILASIRRIISDDDTGEPPPQNPVRGRTSAAAKAEAKDAKKAAARNGQDDADALPAGFDVSADQETDDPAHARLTAAMIELGEAMHASVPGFDGTDHSTDAVADDTPGPVRPRERRAMPVPEGALLSARTTAAVDNAFNSLAKMVLTQNPRTLEDLVCDMLKPMLKAWLDDNLPDIVERLVRAEIERVSRGRG